EVERLFARIHTEHPPLRGVVHAAGVAWPRPLVELSTDDLEAVFAPKVRGGWNLHRATERLGLDFFVLFSSAAATWGSTELAHYAGANHFLDALAEHRASRGLPALSVAWGRWEGEGMTSEARHDWLGRIGMEVFTVREGLDALQRPHGEGAVRATVARMDWRRVTPDYGARPRGPRLGGAEQPQGAAPAAGPAGRGAARAG